MLIDRYLFKELVWPFLFATAVFGSLMTTGFVLFNLIEESLRFTIPPWLFVQIFLLRVPEMLFYTLPMAMLLAALMAMARLSTDGELMILRTSGWSFPRLLVPFLLFSGLAAGATLLLNETLTPAATWLARQALQQAQGRQAAPLLQEHLVFKEVENEALKRLFYARSFDGREMRGVTVQLFEAGQSAILHAQSASLENRQWVFRDGELITLAGNAGLRQVLAFQRYALALPPAWGQLAREGRRPQEMTWRELGNHLAGLQRAGQPLPALAVRWHQKLAIPLAAIFFAVLGAPLGARSLPGPARNLGLSLLLVFGYSVAMTLGAAGGETGQIPAWLGAWLPNLLTGGAAVWLIGWRNRWG